MKNALLSISLFLIIATKMVYAESVQLNSYYPPPFSTYEQIQLIPRANDANINCTPSTVGTMFIDLTNTFLYCPDGIDFRELSVVWNQNGNDIFLTDAVSNPNLHVGIGTQSPTHKLHVETDFDLGPQGYFKNNNIFQNISILAVNIPGNRDSGIGFFKNNARIFSLYNDGDASISPMNSLVFEPETGPASALTASGFLGIGTTNPLSQLEIRGVDSDTTTEVGTLKITSPLGGSMLFDGNKIDTLDNPLNFQPLTTQRATLARGGGRVAIGDPQGFLRTFSVIDAVADDTPVAFFRHNAIGVSNEQILAIKSFGGDAGLSIFKEGVRKWSIRSEGQILGPIPNGSLVIRGEGLDLFLITQAGRVAVGGQAPSVIPDYRLDIDGTIFADIGAGGFAPSDRRLKKTIKSLTMNALNIVGSLRPVSFEWRDPKDAGMEGEQLGFVAQEVEPLLKQAVVASTDPDQMKGMKYNALLPVLTKALQELRFENKLLKNRIDVLEQDIEWGSL